MAKCPGCGNQMMNNVCPKCGKNKGPATPKGKPVPPKKGK